MDLHLHEAITLISLNDEKGNYTAAGGYINYAFGAALLTDLILAERVAVEDDRVKLVTNAITDSRALNAVIDQLSRRKKPMKVSSWIHTLVQRSTKLYKLCVEKLIKEGILERREKKILWVFSVNRYPTVDGEPENELRQRLKTLMLDDTTTPDRKERMLLVILLHCELYTDFFDDKSERKRAKARLEALTEDSLMEDHIGKTIREMQAAVMVATTSCIVT
ncbi:MAG TPA: GPP34 family phosphoprotein [Phaeodactylibacter sp.]|nr:GPP34 family phosphoprotein [Phaeodactylibacter sp.]